jgi:DNA-directed RNA polymerase specialized sigma24 family protein
VAEVEQVYRKHGSALLLFASAISGERSLAQDAVHQVFLKLIEDGSLLQAVDVKAYLFACVRNAVLRASRWTADSPTKSSCATRTKGSQLAIGHEARP